MPILRIPALSQPCRLGFSSAPLVADGFLMPSLEQMAERCFFFGGEKTNKRKNPSDLWCGHMVDLPMHLVDLYGFRCIGIGCIGTCTIN